ncbi:hypothetical protein Tcan_10973 [Toxocara canis]|uniref:Uncharacterized protein n=1 Tax=Toxocara canis TaxID=6265 RepID=A0A0B2V4S0_TOXCA|nr:hypothetical protein Tcan_10973 [Toxocara canis]
MSQNIMNDDERMNGKKYGQKILLKTPLKETLQFRGKDSRFARRRSSRLQTKRRQNVTNETSNATIEQQGYQRRRYNTFQRYTVSNKCGGIPPMPRSHSNN